MAEDRLEAGRHLLIEGLRDGFVTLWRIAAVTVDATGEPDDEFALQLKLTLTESDILTNHAIRQDLMLNLGDDFVGRHDHSFGLAFMVCWGCKRCRS